MAPALLAKSAAGDVLLNAVILCGALLVPLLLILIPVAVIKLLRRAKVPGTKGNELVMGSRRERCYTRAAEQFEAWMAAHPDADVGPVVEFEFQTFVGVAIATTEWTHRERMPSVPAKLLLKELHAFNLRYGVFTHFMLFIPLLSYYNYRRQLAVIRRAERLAGMA